MTQTLNDRGAIKALLDYHEDLSARLEANTILNTHEIHRIMKGTQSFSQHRSPLMKLEELISTAEQFMDSRIVGRGGVRDEHVEYCRSLAAWLVAYKDCLKQYGDDVPWVQRYVRLVKEHVDGGQDRVEAAMEPPGFRAFEDAIHGIQSPAWVFQVDNLNPPARSRDSEADSAEIVWLNDYYGELLEIRDLFKNAKLVFVSFAGWALLAMPSPTSLPPWEERFGSTS